MPYIPWANFGICKFWMLKRCYSGDRCQWEHPTAAERKRLWDEKTAEQDAEAAKGVPRPTNPRLRARADRSPEYVDSVIRYGGEIEYSRARPGGAVRPPPHPSPPPVHKLQEKVSAAPNFDHAQLPTAFAGRRSGRPDYDHLSSNSGREVSIFHAPGSPAARSPSNGGAQPRANCLDGHFDEAASRSFESAASGQVGIGGAVSVWRRDGAVTGETAMSSERDMAITAADPVNDGQSVQDNHWTQFSSRGGAESMKRQATEVRKEVRGSMSAKQLASFPNITPTSPAIHIISGNSPTSTTMGATKRLSNGEVKHVGPHPSTIRVSARYASHASVEKRLQPQPAAGAQAVPDVQERLTAEAREDSIRLQGCRWLDDVRRQMQLPIRTFTTACTYYHKFRLAHPQHVAGMEYGNAWADACAASLLTACKAEDTLKKSKDILAAAHNLRAATTGGEQVGTDDAMFEAPSRVVIGLERLVLEAGSFDFRSKYPHELMVKIAKTLDGEAEEKRAITGLAWPLLTDLHRTFAPLKQTSASMAVASLELASHLYAAGTPNDSSVIRDSFADFNFEKHSTSREEVMETILDALDLYTHHTMQTLLGSTYSLDDYLRIRLAFNKECTENTLPRFTLASPRDSGQEPNGNTLRVQNGHPTPVSPPQPDTQTQTQPQPNAQSTAEGGTLRFMLNPQLAADEKTEVQKYFVEEWEEYEEEIEVPLPRAPSPDRGSDRSDRRPPPPGPPRAPPPGPPRADYRGGGRYDDRRPGHYEDRRYEDRRYDDRRGGAGGRYDDRRYDDRRRDRR